MPYIVKDGMAERVESTVELDAHIAAGVRVYATLAGCVLNEGVQASAFDRPVACEPLYDGHAYLKEGKRVQVGSHAAYSIVAVPGLRVWPPVSAHDLLIALGEVSHYTAETRRPTPDVASAIL